MANPLPPPGQPFQTPAHHTTYASYYSDATLDPYQGNYARLFDCLDPEVNNVVSHVILLEQAVLLRWKGNPLGWLVLRLSRRYY
jgi:hypothetical protein